MAGQSGGVRTLLAHSAGAVLTRLWLLPLVLLATISTAQAACRQALVMALDVSSSVDGQEYALQMQGLAKALLDKDVQALLLSQPSAPVELAVFEWSGKYDQRLILNWTTIGSAADLANIANLLMAQTRSGDIRPTAIGNALKYAGNLLETGPPCWQQTIDISGDGMNNDGFRPQDAKRAPVFAVATVNGLVIGEDAPPGDKIAENEIAELSSYFRQEVINGRDAFIEIALGFQGFEAAMKRKLLRELNIAVASNDY